MCMWMKNQMHTKPALIGGKKASTTATFSLKLCHIHNSHKNTSLKIVRVWEFVLVSWEK